MTAKNDVTGDKLATKPASDAYRDNWDQIFGRAKYSTTQIRGQTLKDLMDDADEVIRLDPRGVVLDEEDGEPV